MNSLNIGIAYLVGAAIALTALYLAERRYGVRRVIPAALATLATLVLGLGIDAPARADVTPCASTRNGWTYDHCAGVITPGPDAWTKPGSKAPFVVTLWRRDVKGGPQTREARVTVAALAGFPADLGAPGQEWCGLQWDVTRDGTWLAGAQMQWTCPTPSPTTTTPTTTETSWTSSPSTTSSSSAPTSSTPSTTTAPSGTGTPTYPTPTSSRPTTPASAPSTRGSTPTTTRHHPYGSSTSPAPTRPTAPVATLADTGEDWLALGAALGAGAVVLGGWLVWVRRSERGGRYRR